VRFSFVITIMATFLVTGSLDKKKLPLGTLPSRSTQT
jgi:hypothetical protein